MATDRACQFLEDLLAGNRRFAEETRVLPRQGAEHRMALLSGQRPQAAVVCCSDSRVPPEIIFDQGLGDLFVVRTAGNIVDNIGLGSIEYAAEHLEVPLVIVLGHSCCGAVQATVERVHGLNHMSYLVEAIRPAVERAKTQPGDLIENAVNYNIERTVRQLSASGPILCRRIQEGELQILGAYYDMASGKVQILPPTH